MTVKELIEKLEGMPGEFEVQLFFNYSAFDVDKIIDVDYDKERVGINAA